MAENQSAIFEAEDGSTIWACDFGPEFADSQRYLSLPDLEPIIPVDLRGIYFICRSAVFATLSRDRAA